LLNLDTDHASATFRGFRLQTLYAIYKIFSSDHKLSFIPEGAEDLAIFDAGGSLGEAVQVKSGTTLSPSSLKSSFFKRSVERMTSNPQSHLRIVMFGTISPELLRACQENGKERQSVITKLLNRDDMTVTKAQLETLFNSMQAEMVDEKTITDQLLTLLKDSLAGVDPTSAFELLTKWIDRASESRERINKQLLHEKIVAIGNFLHGRAAHHEQWFSTIVPVEDSVIESSDTAGLSKNYYQGEAARFEHILSNLDVKRTNKLQQMQQMLDDRNVLFVHGASGQGKSTLAYRFLYDYYPQTLRFRIALTENRQHALTIAQAISKHVKAIDLPVIVYVDVSPYDNGWEELVKALAVYPNIQLLITIREEDWKKSRVSGVEFSFHEMDLQFDPIEAEEIFDVMFAQKKIWKHLTFSEAWAEFGGNGPLLEFIYLLTQGGRLKERLQEQIDILISEEQYGDNTLKLLRSVAVATACGARIKVKEAVEQFQVVQEKTFKRLEAEYLLRLDETKEWISAFHPLRSVILEQILLDPGYAAWIDQIEAILKLLHSEDIEKFLLHSFSKHFEERKELLKILYTYHPANWEALKGVIRALSWLDVKEFIDQRIDDITAIYGTREGHLVLSFGADLMKVGNNEWHDILNSFIFSDEQRNQATEIRERLGLEYFQFVSLPLWLENLEPINNMPVGDQEWMAFAITSLWLWKFNAPFQDKISCDFTQLTYEAALSIQTVAEVTRALFYVHTDAYDFWTECYRVRTLERVQHKYQVCEIEENDESVKAHFISIDLRANEAENRTENIVHEKTLLIIDLLHLLYPDKNYYSTQGYGHNLLGIEKFDDSTKNISTQTMYIQEFTTVNGYFRRIIDDYFRDDDWQKYIDEVLNFRAVIQKNFTAVIPLLNQFFKNKKPKNTLHNSIVLKQWQESETELRNTFLLPNSAKSSKRYELLHKYLNHYQSSLLNFFSQAITVFDINGAIGKQTKEEQENSKRLLESTHVNMNIFELSWINLTEAKSSLYSLQQEFERIFKDLIDEKSLHVIEQKELGTIHRLSHLWYFFVHHSNITTKKADLEFTKRFEDRKKQNLSKIIAALNENETGAHFSIFKKSSKKVLWILTEHENPYFAWYACFEGIELFRQFMVEQSDFSKTVMQWYFSAIHFLPLSKGYIVNNMYLPMSMTYSTYLTRDDELSPLQLIPKELSKDDFSMFQYDNFESDNTKLLHEIFESASKLLGYLSHLKEFKACPESSTESGRNMLLSYSELVNEKINEVFNEALHKCGTFSKELKEYEEMESLEIKEVFLNVYSAIYPEELLAGNKPLGVDEMEIWAEKLKENVGKILTDIIPLIMNLDLEREGPNH